MKGLLNRTIDRQTYQAGFHVFATKGGAFAYARRMGLSPISVKYVKVMGIRASGLQNGHPCIVTDWLMIPLEEEI